jgi:N-acetylglucosamine kinase-like BadF-type ATPase
MRLIKSFSFNYGPALTIINTSEDGNRLYAMKIVPQQIRQDNVILKNFMGPRKRAQRTLLLGVDGGGTKTRAVVTDADYRVLGEGTAGPSNPLRVGFDSAFSAIHEAVGQACKAAGISSTEISAAEIGLAGVRRPQIRKQMRERLNELGIASLELVTDSDIALFGSTEGKPGLVVIAGTGSICCGINSKKSHFCAGGWGPLAGDEGSGSWIARRALQAVARAADGRDNPTALTAAACEYFNMASPDELSAAIYAPSMTHERIAGFCTHVINAAKAGDETAREIVEAAGRELGLQVRAAIRSLHMTQERFKVAYVGGVFAAGELVLGPMRAEIESVAPGAYLVTPHLSPVIAAARMAKTHLPQMALAG